MEGEKINTVFFKPSARFIRLVAAGVLFAATSQANAVAYTFTDLGSLVGGDGFSAAYGINNAGQVVGYSYGHGDGIPAQTVLWNGADMTELGRLPGVRYPNIASAINDSGQIVGSSGLGDDSSDFFLKPRSGMAPP